MKSLKKLKLNEKLTLFTSIVLVPFVLLVIYALTSMADYYQQYDQIVRNITAANEYVTFKDDLDYTMYRYIIGSENWSNPEKKINKQDPYVQIQEMRDAFDRLLAMSDNGEDQKRIRGIIKLLNTLEDRVDDIVANVEEGGHYDENMEMLDMNIRILTNIIKEQVQQYIYFEAMSMETVRQSISGQADFTLQVLTFLLLAIVVLTLLISRILAKSITKPIRKLCAATEQFAKGDFEVFFECDSGDELDMLGDTFNSMVKEISVLVEDIRTEQRNLRATELKLLQAQINPHFLYNTLDTIVWLAEGGRKEEVVAMVTSLSDFFRTTLSKGRDLITIREEVSHITSYLEIQQFRYRDILEYEIAIPESLYHYQILKLTLQPIVENALYHGIKNKRGKGKITVTAEKEGETIRFTVSDNGRGMTEGVLSHVRKIIDGSETDSSQSGFGMANVEQRIRLNFGGSYGVRIDSVFGRGTEVAVLIPAVFEGEEIKPFS